MDLSRFEFRIVTIKSAPIRSLIEALKDILTEANIEIDSAGLRICTTDGTHATLVHLYLDAGRFESWHCPRRQVLGVNMINLFKLIKMMANNESLVLYQEKGDTEHLGIDILNAEKQKVTSFKLNLIDIDVAEQPKLPENLPLLRMPAADFQKVIRDMYTLGDTVEIRSAATEVAFRCKGDFAEQETVFKFGSTEGGDDEEEGDIYQGFFSLKFLALFTKCTGLCSEVNIYTRNNVPLICEYAVASYGVLKLALAPKTVTSA